MTRTLQERPGLPGSARNDPPPEPVGFLSAYPGYRSTALLDNRERVTPAKRVGPGPGDPGWTPGRRTAESYRNEQLQPATQVRVRGSQIEVDRVQS